jgi:iron complex outermembrane recepter protein
LIKACIVIAASALMTWAQATGSISGRVLDASGGAAGSADVSATNSASGAVMKTTSAPDGSFHFESLAAGQYKVTVQKKGFATFSRQVTLTGGQTATVQANLVLETVVQTVNVNAQAEIPGATAMPSQQDVLQSSQTIRVLDRRQMDAAGPVAGAAQILSYTPGANVTGYGNTGATKYTVMLNGVNQGWGGYGGYTNNGLLGITFDGIPVVDPATGLWQSPTIPQTALIQNTTVTYGPGDPASRWFTDLGGGIEFTPIQPTAKPSIDVSMSYGSYSQKNLAVTLRTGTYHGWSAVISGGAGAGDSYRVGPDGFGNSSEDHALFFKGTKSFQSGSFELGAYYADSTGYRPQVIPLTANPAITFDAQPGSPVYSQQTSGFYSTLAYDSYNKKDSNKMALVYGRLNVRLDDTTTLHNQLWYMRIDRLHNRLNDVYSPGPQVDEWNNPYTNSVGDKLWVTKTLPFNTLEGGAYILRTLYNTRNNFYDPAAGGDGPNGVVNIGGKVRSGYFNQDIVGVFLQDDIHPIAMLHITPGLRFDRYETGYYNNSLQDFTFAPGVVLSTHCPSTLTSTSGNTTDQGADCSSRQTRTGVEPSIDVSLSPVRWLNLYGGYLQTRHAPQVGGGGGLFQKVDPSSYHLARGDYYQGGAKLQFSQVGPLRNVLFGAAFYHMTYTGQEIDIGLANGDLISASGSSTYHGLNAYVDADPMRDLHTFFNLNAEAANYSTYDNGGTLYNGLPVSYVPSTTLNIGGYYEIRHSDRVLVEPRLWYQFVGTQHIFDNQLGAPSNQTMPSYGTLNLAFNIPFKFLSLKVNMLNLLNKQYNEYEYISSGGYFGTPDGGYTLAYPASPFTVYSTVDFHF